MRMVLRHHHHHHHHHHLHQASYFMRSGGRPRIGTRRRPMSSWNGPPKDDPFTNFDVQILGSASRMPTTNSNCSCVGLRVWNSHLLFDCGEGTQRQMQRSFLTPSKIQGILITHMHGDHLFGLPGILLSFLGMLQPQQTSSPVLGQGDHLSSSSGRGNPSRKQATTAASKTIRVYGPQGLYNYLSMTMKLCEARIGVNPQDGSSPIIVYELLGAENGGGIGGNKAAFHQSYQDFQVPGMQWQGIEREADGFWTLPFPDSENHYSVRAGQIKHTVTTFGYTVKEKDRKGNIDVDKVKALGLKPGPEYKLFKEGKDVKLSDDRVIKASDVVGPGRPGRKLTVLGDTCDPYAMAPLAQHSDLLIHEATLENAMQKLAISRGHSTPRMAAQFAKDIEASRLLLTHFSNRYGVSPAAYEEGLIPFSSSPSHHDHQHHAGTIGEEDEYNVSLLVKEAAAVLGADRVLAAYDYMGIHVPFEGFDGGRRSQEGKGRGLEGGGNDYSDRLLSERLEEATIAIV